MDMNQSYWALFWAEILPLFKFHGNLLSSCFAILLTNQLGRKHNLIGGGDKK